MNPLTQSIEVWCPTFPRRVTQYQQWVTDEEQVYDAIMDVNGDSPGYVSVYAFPEGHPKHGHVPIIDTMFIDFDIPATGEYRGENPGDPEKWREDMDELLERINAISRALVEAEKADYWRAALSGHKGVHLYLDFDSISTDSGTIDQFRIGLRRFAQDMVDEMEHLTGFDLDPWVDVDSSDLARLTRLPNTIHEGATDAFGERRYCVPVSVAELVDMTPDDYERLTRMPRPVPTGGFRVSSGRASTTLTQYVRQTKTTRVRGSKKTGVTLNQYDAKKANHEIELDDLPMLMSRKPCLWHFRERDDMFAHENQSHMMKLAVLCELYNNRVPVDVIYEFFDSHPDHDRNITEHELDAVVRYGYSPFKHETIEAECPVFLDERCGRCLAAMVRPSTTVSA